MQWPLFLTAFVYLLTGSYLDNIRGPLMPVLNHELGIGYDQSSLLFVAASIGAITAALFLTLTERWGIGNAKRFSVILGVAVCCIGVLVEGIPTLIAFGFCLGATVASLGTISNILVAFASPPEKRALAFNGLHSMYGLASALGPSVISVTVSRGWAWQVALIPVAVFIALLAFLPVKGSPVAPATTEKNPKVTPLGGWMITTFVIYVLGEILTSIWMVSFLTESRGHTIESASPYLTAFFIAMALSRLLAIRNYSRRGETAMLWGSIGAFVGFQLIGLLIHPIGLSLSGLTGPFFPILMARMSRLKGAQSLMLKLFLFIPISSALANLALGQLTRIVSLDRLIWVCPGFGILAALSLTAIIRLEGRKP